MAENTELVKQLITTITVAPGTTHNGGPTNVAVINNREHPIEVQVYELAPPPPPPKCGKWVADDDYEGSYLSCTRTEGHPGIHRGKIGETDVWWGPDND